jgi:hypothetical protein
MPKVSGKDCGHFEEVDLSENYLGDSGIGSMAFTYSRMQKPRSGVGYSLVVRLLLRLDLRNNTIEISRHLAKKVEESQTLRSL